MSSAYASAIQRASQTRDELRSMLSAMLASSPVFYVVVIGGNVRQAAFVRTLMEDAKTCIERAAISEDDRKCALIDGYDIGATLDLLIDGKPYE